MDLKEFITETVESIARATAELQVKLESCGAIVNPPVDAQDNTNFRSGSAKHTYRRIQNIDFDVAVTASSESLGGGKAGLKVLSFGAGVEGQYSRLSEQVSRVKFTIPIVLPPSSAEAETELAASSVKRAGYFPG